MLGSPTCQPLTKDLIAYGGRPLKVKGKCFINVKLGDKQCQNMPLIVVNKLRSNLFALDWSDTFGLTEEGISAMKSVDIDPTLSSNSLQEVNVLNGKQFSELKEKFNDVFPGKLRKCKQVKANVHLKPKTKPNFHKL